MSQVTTDASEIPNPFPNGRYYQHSGIVPKYSVLTTFAFLIPISLILGVLYGIANFWAGLLASLLAPIPLIGGFAGLLDLIPLWLLVIALTSATDSVTKFRKIRRPGLSTMFRLVIACLAYYICWVVWVASFTIHYEILDSIGHFDLTTELLKSPPLLWELIQGIGQNRPVAVIFPMPYEANWLFWIVEFCLVFGGVWTITHGLTIDQPFCEKCQKWFIQKDACCWFEPSLETSEICRAFDEDHKEPLDVLIPIPLESVPELFKKPGSFYRADLEYCPECEAARTIDIDLVSRTTTKDEGEFEESSTTLIQNLWVTAEHFKKIKSIAAIPSTDADRV